MIQETTLQEIRAVANDNLVEIARDYLKLKSTGSGYSGRCPFHEEKTPSFSIKVQGANSFFKCFGCGEGGDAIKLVREMEGWDFYRTACYLAGRFGIHIPQQANRQRKSWRERLNKQIPGVFEKRSVIRRAGYGLLCFTKSLVSELNNEDGELPILFLPSHLSRTQAKILAKYTDQVRLVDQKLERFLLFNTISAALRQNLDVKVSGWDPQTGKIGKSRDWLVYLTDRFHLHAINIEHINRLIAGIPNAISEQVYTEKFVNIRTQIQKH